jgi:hypothetical protein
MEYNTRRVHLLMREYGRHIQKMVDYVMSIEDEEKRQQQAQVMIELMGFLNPQLSNIEDYRHKLWDHLFFISDFKLQVESPYPIPQKETYRSKPEPLPYPKGYPKYSHLGKNLQAIIEKGLAETDQEKKNGYANCIAYYMKLAYNNWHKENIHDDAIRTELDAITNGQLDFTNTPYVKYYRPGDNNDQREGGNNNRPGRGGNNRNFRQMGNRSGGGGNRSGGGGNYRSGGGGGNRGGNSGGGGNRNNNFRKKRY